MRVWGCGRTSCFTAFRRASSTSLIPGLYVYPEAFSQSEVQSLAAAYEHLHDSQRASHVDSLISGYNERNIPFYSFSKDLLPLVARLRLIALAHLEPQSHTRAANLSLPPLLDDLHILALAATGSVAPHTDSPTAGGGVVTGLTTESATLLTLQRPCPSNGARREQVSVMLPVGSVYVISHDARFTWDHGIWHSVGSGGGAASDSKPVAGIRFQPSSPTTISEGALVAASGAPISGCGDCPQCRAVDEFPLRSSVDASEWGVDPIGALGSAWWTVEDDARLRSPSAAWRWPNVDEWKAQSRLSDPATASTASVVTARRARRIAFIQRGVPDDITAPYLMQVRSARERDIALINDAIAACPALADTVGPMV